jgi:hypothetical protein
VNSKNMKCKKQVGSRFHTFDVFKRNSVQTLTRDLRGFLRPAWRMPGLFKVHGTLSAAHYTSRYSLSSDNSTPYSLSYITAFLAQFLKANSDSRNVKVRIIEGRYFICQLSFVLSHFYFTELVGFWLSGLR